MPRQTSATIIERKHRLDGSVEEYGCDVLVLEPGRRAALRYVLARDRDIGDTPLRVPKGAVTVGHYWTDRPYNVYHWLVGGRTLAYYCNVVTRTAITPDLVEYDDLVVDVLLEPSGAAHVLDEEELPADLPSERRIAIAKALEAIITNPRALMREVERETEAALRA